MTKEYDLNISISANGEGVNVHLKGDHEGDPLADAIRNEMRSVAAEICRKIRTGDYLGGWERDEDGTWYKPLGSTHKDGGKIPPDGYANV